MLAAPAPSVRAIPSIIVQRGAPDRRRLVNLKTTYLYQKCRGWSRPRDLQDEFLATVAKPKIRGGRGGAAALGERSFSLITFLAEKLLGNLAVPLVVVPGNLSYERIANMT